MQWHAYLLTTLTPSLMMMMWSMLDMFENWKCGYSAVSAAISRPFLHFSPWPITIVHSHQCVVELIVRLLIFWNHRLKLSLPLVRSTAHGRHATATWIILSWVEGKAARWAQRDGIKSGHGSSINLGALPPIARAKSLLQFSVVIALWTLTKFVLCGVTYFCEFGVHYFLLPFLHLLLYVFLLSYLNLVAPDLERRSSGAYSTLCSMSGR